MEGKFRGKAHRGSLDVSDLKAVGKKSLEWDLNDWRWDGDLFTATQLIAEPSDCRSRQFLPNGPGIAQNDRNSLKTPSSRSDENNEANGNKEKREYEKRRRVVADDGGGLHDESESINFNLGGQVYPIMDLDAKSGKKNKVNVDVTIPSNCSVCQVQDCKVELSNAKDYLRRHKVCEMHSKASEALVGNVIQRFCQQCSRFHVLQEFDEEKRSCRRRLAGHNKRRRKTLPENVVTQGSLPSDRSSSYLLISLLRILSNVHANKTDPEADHDFLSNLLKNLGSLAGSSAGTSSGNLNKATNMFSNGSGPATTSGSNFHDLTRLVDHSGSVPASCPSSAMQFQARGNLSVNGTQTEATVGEINMKNIDLNDDYIDSQDHEPDINKSHKPRPPQLSGNSDSTSSQSPSSSSGEAKSRTDRIVFKLFGKEPSEIPVVLRKQILDWLSDSPTDIEGYIRPGCIVLTVYLRLRGSAWDELCFALGSRLRKLLDASNDPFWRTGWVYTRVQHSVAFICNGQVVLDAALPLESHKNCRISSIRPIAVPSSERVQFAVKGSNLYGSTTRLLCALEGTYLAHETRSYLLNSTDSSSENDDLQYLSFSCSIPKVYGRGFIEVEDHGLSSSFFPFIVAEEELCSEIRRLEAIIEAAEIPNDIHKQSEQNEAKNQALGFIHEMGWLLHRSQSKFQSGQLNSNSDFFPFTRFNCLMEFSLDHEWCAVVKKLIDILIIGTVDSGEHSSVKLALIDIGLLHKAVRRNCRPMVELLLRYVPDKDLGQPGLEQKHYVGGVSNGFIFRPDITGPAGLTPLHVAASAADSEDVLDALTDDPGMVGIEAWKSSRDSTGLTPNDYACLRGYHSYTQLVQRKLNKKKKKSESGHLVLDIPNAHNPKSRTVGSFPTEMSRRHCKICCDGGKTRSPLVVYRPAMLSMVAIAAVCVCVALLFKSSPEVLYIFRPFSWELLKYGSS